MFELATDLRTCDVKGQNRAFSCPICSVNRPKTYASLAGVNSQLSDVNYMAALPRDCRFKSPREKPVKQHQAAASHRNP